METNRIAIEKAYELYMYHKGSIDFDTCLRVGLRYVSEIYGNV